MKEMEIEYEKNVRKKVSLNVSLAEKVAWFKRMREFEFEKSLAHGVRQCVRMQFDYSIVDNEVVEHEFQRKPPEIEKAILNFKDYTDSTKISVIVRGDEFKMLQKKKFALEYRSVEALMIDSVRRILSIPPYGIAS